MKLFNFKLKKLLFFLGERLRVFHQFILRCFHFHINFTIFYVCFHYWLHLFTSLFLQVFLFHHWVYYCFSSVFISPTFFTVALFCQLLCFCAVVPPMLRIWESFFYSKVFFTIHSFRTFDTTCFYQGIPGAGNSAMNIAGLPTEVRNTDPVHLFVWITQCSAKGICR